MDDIDTIYEAAIKAGERLGVESWISVVIANAVMTALDNTVDKADAV
jgi:hypothetical protein